MISFTCLSAEHDTPIPTGHEAPCLGRRITLTSWQKYFPPNCAPIPALCVNLWISSSSFLSLNPRPCSFPEMYQKYWYNWLHWVCEWFLFNATWEAANANFMVFGFNWVGLKPTIYRTHGLHSNHYTTNVIVWLYFTKWALYISGQEQTI